MTELVTFDLELRFIDQDDGALTGVCVPYNQVTYVAPGQPKGERFLARSFARSIELRGADKVRLVDSHQEGMRRRPYGVASDLQDTPDGLLGSFRFYPTPTGQEGRSEARAGTYGGLSVGFQALKERRAPDGVREIVEAVLHHVALVDEPAYSGAALLAVREQGEPTRSPYAVYEPPQLVDIPNVL